MAMLTLSPVLEDYLKVIYEVSQAQPGQAVPAAALIDRLGAAPATVTETVKRLAKLGLLVHRRYRGVTLTPAGEQIALKVIRHHRLLEQYLAEVLGLPWNEVQAEAEQLEHVLSEALEARIAAALGYLTLDSHGDPILTANLTVISTIQEQLASRQVGDPEPI